MLNEMVRLQTKLKRGKDTHSTRGRTRADLTSWRVQFQDFWVNKMQRESIHGAVGSYGGVLTHWDDFLEHLANPDYFGRMAKMRVCVGDEVGGKECGINHQREVSSGHMELVVCEGSKLWEFLRVPDLLVCTKGEVQFRVDGTPEHAETLTVRMGDVLRLRQCTPRVKLSTGVPCRSSGCSNQDTRVVLDRFHDGPPEFIVGSCGHQFEGSTSEFPKVICKEWEALNTVAGRAWYKVIAEIRYRGGHFTCLVDTNVRSAQYPADVGRPSSGWVFMDAMHPYGSKVDNEGVAGWQELREDRVCIILHKAAFEQNDHTPDEATASRRETYWEKVKEFIRSKTTTIERKKSEAEKEKIERERVIIE